MPRSLNGGLLTRRVAGHRKVVDSKPSPPLTICWFTRAAQRSTNDCAKKHEHGEQADRRTPEGCSAGIVSEGYEDGKRRAKQDDPRRLLSLQKAAAQLVGCQKSRRNNDCGHVVGERVGSSEKRARRQYCRLQLVADSRAPAFPHDGGATKSDQSLNQPSQLGRPVEAADQPVRALEISPVALRIGQEVQFALCGKPARESQPTARRRTG